MSGRSILAATAASGLLVASVAAEQMALPVTGAQLAARAEGRAEVVLSVARPVVLGHVSLGAALLRLPGDLVGAGGEQRIHVLALRSPWSGGEPDVHEDLAGRVSLPPRSRLRSMDVTNLVRGIPAEEGFAGLLVTTPDRSGFDADDAARIQQALAQAVLEVSFRRVPPPPRRRGA